MLGSGPGGVEVAGGSGTGPLPWAFGVKGTWECLLSPASLGLAPLLAGLKLRVFIPENPQVTESFMGLILVFIQRTILNTSFRVWSHLHSFCLDVGPTQMEQGVLQSHVAVSPWRP